MAVWAPGWQRDRQGDTAKIACAKHEETSPYLHSAKAKQSNSNEPLTLYQISFLQAFMWAKLRSVKNLGLSPVNLKKVLNCQQEALTLTIYIKLPFRGKKYWAFCLSVEKSRQIQFLFYTIIMLNSSFIIYIPQRSCLFLSIKIFSKGQKLYTIW